MAAKSVVKMIFGEKSPVDSAYTLQVKNFIEVTLSCTISKINALSCYTQKLKDGGQKWLESDYWGKFPVDSSFRDKCAFAFYTEIQDG